MTLKNETDYLNNQVMDEEIYEECLLCAVGETTWAIPTSVLEQTFYLDTITPIPLMPPSVVGLTNLSGVAVPVLNLAMLEKNPLISERLHGKRCIVVKQGEISVALLSDDIFSIIKVKESLKEKDSGNLYSFSFVFDEEYTLLLDADKLFRIIRGTIRESVKQYGLGSSNW